MLKPKSDTFFALTLAVFSLTCAIQAFYLPGDKIELGPRAFPLFLSILLLLISVVFLAKPGEATNKTAASWQSWLAITISVLYALLLPLLGYLIATPLFLLSFAYTIGSKRLIPMLLLCAVWIIGVELVFRNLLMVPIPFLGEWIQ